MLSSTIEITLLQSLVLTPIKERCILFENIEILSNYGVLLLLLPSFEDGEHTSSMSVYPKKSKPLSTIIIRRINFIGNTDYFCFEYTQLYLLYMFLIIISSVQ